MINRAIIGIMLTAGIIMYFAIVASMISVKTNPDNPANYLVQDASGQLSEFTAPTNKDELTPEWRKYYDGLGKLDSRTARMSDVFDVCGHELQTGESTHVNDCNKILGEYIKAIDNVHRNQKGLLENILYNQPTN
jgi:hypothetical protein